jgi:hypothetical protein
MSTLPRSTSVVALFVLLAISGSAAAQESKSAAVAKELTQLLDRDKLDSVAAKDPAAPDAFVAALYFPGSLLVVGAKYSVPVLLDEKLGKKDYKEIYIDLNSASVPASKMFVEDLGANGLRAKREDGQPQDSVDAGGRQTTFDGDWRRQKMSQDEYMKAFAAADESYARMLTALVEQLKKK